MLSVWRLRPCTILAAVAVLISSTSVAAQEKKDPKADEPKKDTRVEPTSWGHVIGRVYDSKTGLPIKDALILGCTDNGFEEKGKSTGKTDSLGGYDIQLILGRISNNFDLGRAILSSPLMMLFGSATNTTKRIDVSRVALKIEAPGYKPFQGVVTARATDASKFRIEMQPILLVPAGVDGASVVANGWNAIRVARVEASPGVAVAKDKVQLVAYLQGATEELVKTTEMAAYSDLWKGAKKLNLDKSTIGQNLVKFSADHTISGKEKTKAVPVFFSVTKSKVDFDPSKTTKYALLQISTAGEDRKAFDERTLAIEALRKREFAPARDVFSNLVRAGSKESFDWQMAVDLSMRVGDPESAQIPAASLFEADPKNRETAERYLSVLYAAGKDDEVINVGEAITKGVKDKELGKKINADSMGYLGLAYLRKGDLKSADTTNDKLLNIDASGLSEVVIEFRGKLRLAEVERAHTNDPKSAAALAEYGRALLDLGRFEEAVAKLAESAQVDSQSAVQRDLAWAMLQMRGGKKPEVDLEKAVGESRATLGLEKGQQRSKDFFTWNQYGILLFALSEQKRTAGAEDAPAVRDQAIEALREALTLGRKGAKRNAGFYGGSYFGYMSGAETAISGFAYPQANMTFVLLDSLRKLRKNESDPLALLNAATALIDLGQNALAGTYASRLLTVDPENVEGMFVQSLVLHRIDDLDGAAGNLRKVLSAAPNHPRANLVLADILTEQGDAVGASERIAAHATFYGEVDRK